MFAFALRQSLGGPTGQRHSIQMQVIGPGSGDASAKPDPFGVAADHVINHHFAEGQLR